MAVVINSELANNIGNLVQRTLAMIHKNCGGLVPDPQGVEKDELDMSFLEKVHVTKPETRASSCASATATANSTRYWPISC
jgi:methionyl-tRNA synthetase